MTTVLNMPGQPVKAKEAPKPKREFRFKTSTGKARVINADHVRFMPHHVVFWAGTEEAQSLFLVEAVFAANVHDLQEVEDLL